MNFPPMIFAALFHRYAVHTHYYILPLQRVKAHKLITFVAFVLAWHMVRCGAAPCIGDIFGQLTHYLLVCDVARVRIVAEKP